MVDMEGASIEKDEEKWFSIRKENKLYNLKFATIEEKESWLDLIARMASK